MGMLFIGLGIGILLSGIPINIFWWLRCNRINDEWFERCKAILEGKL